MAAFGLFSLLDPRHQCILSFAIVSMRYQYVEISTQEYRRICANSQCSRSVQVAAFAPEEKADQAVMWTERQDPKTTNQDGCCEATPGVAALRRERERLASVQTPSPPGFSGLPGHELKLSRNWILTACRVIGPSLDRRLFVDCGRVRRKIEHRIGILQTPVQLRNSALTVTGHRRLRLMTARSLVARAETSPGRPALAQLAKIRV